MGAVKSGSHLCIGLWGYWNRTLHKIVHANANQSTERTIMIKPVLALATATALLVSSSAPSFANNGWHGGGGWHGGWHHHGGGWGVGPAVGLGLGLGLLGAAIATAPYYSYPYSYSYPYPYGSPYPYGYAPAPAYGYGYAPY